MIRARALLVGLGRIGCGYDAHLPFVFDKPRSSVQTLTHARAMACHPGFVLVGGVDPNPQARQRFERLYRVPSYPDLTSWRSTCSDAALDLVVVAVSPQLQPSLVMSLLELITPRLLLLEKPLACDAEQGRALKAACDAHPEMNVAVNYIRRWLPAVQTWRKRLQAGQLGNFLHGNLTYGKGLLSNGSHFVNLAESWLGPLTVGRILDRYANHLDFDREISLELLATDHRQSPLLVRSIGAAGLRAGELDLWFERGRLCWPDHGGVVNFWPRREPAPGDSHAPLAVHPELVPTGLDHYQLVVMEAMHRYLLDPGASPLKCDLSTGLRTLNTLAPAFSDE